MIHSRRPNPHADIAAIIILTVVLVVLVLWALSNHEPVICRGVC